MGGLLSTKKSYERLNEYATNYAGYEINEIEINARYNEQINNIKQNLHSNLNDINNKLSYLIEKNKELEKEIQKKDTIIKKLENENESTEIHLNALSKLLEQRFDIYNKDLDALLKNDKIILKKIEELHPEIKDSTITNNSTNIIKNSFLESNIEYSSFIND
jgi:hypothetical protein